MDPLISIIIPTYNSSSHLRECIDSVLDQDYENIELVIVDGNSKDLTQHIIDEYCSFGNKIIYLKTKKGVSHQRNVGIDSSHGIYVFFLDSDDYIEPTFISSLYKTLLEKSLDIVTPSIANIFFESDKLKKTSIFRGIIRNNIKKENFFVDGYESLLAGPTKLYKREVISGVYFDESIDCGEDLLFNYKISCLNNFKFDICNDAYYYYRHIITGESPAFRRMNRRNLLFYNKLVKIIKDMGNNQNDNFRGAFKILRDGVTMFMKCYLEHKKIIPLMFWPSRLYLYKTTKCFYYLLPRLYYRYQVASKDRKDKNKC